MDGRAMSVAEQRDRADSHDDIRGDRDGQRISGLREIDRVLTDRAAFRMM